MRGETRKTNDLAGRIAISIHSPHARGDNRLVIKGVIQKISIHSPHARGDPSLLRYPARSCHFNPLPSREGRRGKTDGDGAGRAISIHSPHARGDSHRQPDVARPPISIHSPHARGDGFPTSGLVNMHISIHSPHVRGDPSVQRVVDWRANFNPLPSCEGRRARRKARM